MYRGTSSKFTNILHFRCYAWATFPLTLTLAFTLTLTLTLTLALTLTLTLACTLSDDLGALQFTFTTSATPAPAHALYWASINNTSKPEQTDLDAAAMSTAAAPRVLVAFPLTGLATGGTIVTVRGWGFSDTGRVVCKFDDVSSWLGLRQKN